MRAYPPSVACACGQIIGKHVYERTVCPNPRCGWYWCPKCQQLTEATQIPGPLGTRKLRVKGRRPWPPKGP